MDWQDESQLRAQEMRMFEENSYSVIAKKLGCSNCWVSKWARCWKTESLPSQSRRRLSNKTALGLCLCTHIKGHNQLVEIQHWTLYSTGRLVSKFARFVCGWKRLEHYGCCSCSCRPTAADTDGTRTSCLEILEINFFVHCAKSHRVDAWQTEGSHQKQRRQCSVLILSLRTVLK